MSAFPLKADIRCLAWNVCLGPEADKPARSQNASEIFSPISFGCLKTAPKNYGKVLAFERMTVRGPNCPVPTWSWTAGRAAHTARLFHFAHAVHAPTKSPTDRISYSTDAQFINRFNRPMTRLFETLHPPASGNPCVSQLKLNINLPPNAF